MKNLLLLFISFIVFLSPSFGQTVPSYVPTDGLVGWWPFNGNADDESGNGNDGTVNGAVLTEDRDGNANSAYEFSGTYTGSENITGDCSNFPNGNSARTISFWYYSVDMESGDPTQALGYGGNSCGQSFIMNFNNPDAAFGKFEVQGHCLAFHNFTNSPMPLDGVWYNIVVSYDISVFKFYYNGNLVYESLPTELDVYTEDKIFCFGIQPRPDGNEVYIDNLYKGFEGKLDDIGIWNRALTEDEITDLYESTPTSTTDLQSNTLSIYPNPTQDIVTINLESPSKGILKAYDLQGRLIHSQPIQGQSSLDYTIQGEAGLYLIEFVDESGEVYVGKVVKM